MTPSAFFHIPSGTVRFWVLVNGISVGATIGKATLRYRYRPYEIEDEPLATYISNSAEIDAAVRRRVAGGSVEPVMLQDHDVRPAPSVG